MFDDQKWTRRAAAFGGEGACGKTSELALRPTAAAECRSPPPGSSRKGMDARQEHAYLAAMPDRSRKRPRDPNQLAKLVVELAMGDAKDAKARWRKTEK